jgi:hypothetical protein
MQCRMLLVGPSLIAGSVLTLPPVVNADAQPQTITINTSQMRTGLAPRDFAFTLTGDGPVSAWKVVADPTATAEKAIAQTSADATAHRYLLAVYEPLAATSIEVSAHFKPVGGTVDQAAGIAVRFLTPDDYYVVRADVLEDDVRLYRVVNGKRQEIKGAKTKVSANQWHTLGIRAEADRFVVSFDGKSLFAAEDETFTKPGNVALWTEADSLTHFDSISITPLD